MIFRQLLDPTTCTLTYLIGDSSTKEAILIDSVFEQHLRDLALVRELGLTLRYTLETHVHADHVTGAWLMKKETGSQIVVSQSSGAEGADRCVSHGDTLQFGSHEVQVRETPGHTGGCVTYVMPKARCAFTGDALLIRGAGRTDFQQGDAARLYESVKEQIFSLPEDFSLYPGHDYQGRTVTSVGEERDHNPRLGARARKQDFVGYMNNLGLPHPKRMDQAVPANERCGEPVDGQAPRPPGWGPAVRTFAGVWQVDPEWVYRNVDAVTLLDVRETAEVEASPMGQLEDSLIVPLSLLRDKIDSIPTTKPIVTVCPAGARSAFAAIILEKAGIDRVANMSGGIIEWRTLGYPVSPKP